MTGNLHPTEDGDCENETALENHPDEVFTLEGNTMFLVSLPANGHSFIIYVSYK